jgi:hypothetical protein
MEPKNDDDPDSVTGTKGNPMNISVLHTFALLIIVILAFCLFLVISHVIGQIRYNRSHPRQAELDKVYNDPELTIQLDKIKRGIL